MHRSTLPTNAAQWNTKMTAAYPHHHHHHHHQHQQQQQQQHQQQSQYGSQMLTSIRLESASKMSFEQFLLLRVIATERKGCLEFYDECEKGRHITPEAMNLAKSFLDSYGSWQRYLDQVRENVSLEAKETHSSVVEGTFALVLHYQRRSLGMDKLPPADEPLAKVIIAEAPRVTRASAAKAANPQTPTRKERHASYAENVTGEELDDIYAIGLEDLGINETPTTTTSEKIGKLSPYSPVSGIQAKGYKAIEDEQIVNSALILLLQALSLHHPSVRGEWSLYRQGFILRDTSKEKIYEAQVDGVFRNTASAAPTMIAEVKPYVRQSSVTVYDKIRIQEGAQLAAWIGTQGPLTGPNTHSGRLR